MGVHVDLSFKELHPKAVVFLIKEHSHRRPSKNIVFKVTQEAFQLYRRQFKNLLLVSQKEANEINKFLRVSWPRRAYAMRARYPCSNCGRVLTFYDLFETGREQHGDKFMRRILAGGEYNIQVAKNGERLEVHCTACKARNFLRMENGNGNGNGGPPPHSYCAEEYFYA